MGTLALGRVTERNHAATATAPVAATAAALADISRLLPLRSRGIGRAGHGYDGELPLVSITGAYLLSLWGLPRQIVEAVVYRYHPMPAGDETFGIPAVVHVACALAHGEPLDDELIESLDLACEVPA